MGEAKKKFIEYSIAFALSVAGGYFVYYVQVADLFKWPSYAYTMLSIFFGTLFLIFLVTFIRFLVVEYRDSKQQPFDLEFPEETKGKMVMEQWEFKGFAWKTIIRFEGKYEFLDQFRGPYCLKEDCRSELNFRKTFWGRYYYKCPSCSFDTKREESVSTLRNDFKKVVISAGRKKMKRLNKEVFREQ